MGWHEQFYGGNPIGMFVGFIFFILLIGAVAFLVLTALRDHRHPYSGTHGNETDEAKAILDRRFAQGEMTKEDYLDALEVLGYEGKSRHTK